MPTCNERRRGAHLVRRLARASCVGLGVGSLLNSACTGACDESLSCTVAPAARFVIQFVRRADGTAMSGVRVDFRPTGGVSAQSAGGTTDGLGFVMVVVPATAGGNVVGDLTVTPPSPDAPYVVHGFALAATTVTGSGSPIGRWTVAPSLDVLLEVRDRRTQALVVGAQVDYIRTGGAGTSPATLTTTTNSAGVFFLRLQPDALAPVTATIRVHAPHGGPVTEFTGYQLTPSVYDDPPLVRGTLLVDTAG